MLSLADVMTEEIRIQDIDDLFPLESFVFNEANDSDYDVGDVEQHTESQQNDARKMTHRIVWQAS